MTTISSHRAPSLPVNRPACQVPTFWLTMLLAALTAQAQTSESPTTIDPLFSETPDADAEIEPADLEIDEGWKGFFLGPLRVGGALRYNYSTRDYGSHYQDSGELALDTVRVNLDLDTEHIIGSLEYRYYNERFTDNHDYHMLKYAWLGWKIDDESQVRAGLTQVPFGIQTYASHSWFFQLPYYVGLEDDYDLGVKLIHDSGPWEFQLAYFANDGGDYTGDSNDSARYSYDLVLEENDGNEEKHQGNAKLAYTFDHSESNTTEIGLSLQYGLVPNKNTGRDGNQWAVAAHLNGTYGRWNLMLQAIHYKYDLENDPSLDSSPDGSFVTMGAYDAWYHVASEASILTAGLAYTLPIDNHGIQSLTFYNDSSLMLKAESGYNDTVQNVLGCMISANPFYIYIDLAVGKNHPWLGGDWTDGLAEGADDKWGTRFNVNIGLYF
ncbi:MAG: hypothetical protein ACI89L_002443 [Phycisphaerales bacterium]|jgi:hypothetical protein